MKNNKKKGFTLVELLAVIVVLAIILVIAVPKILDVIKNSRKNSLISSVKLVARQAEQKKLTNEILESDEEFECSSIADLSSNDYQSCTIEFDENGNAIVSMTGKGKFSGYTCTGTKNNVTCEEGEPEEEPLTCSNIYWKYSLKEDITTSQQKNDCKNKLDDIKGWKNEHSTWFTDAEEALCNKNYFETEFIDREFFESFDDFVTQEIKRDIDNGLYEYDDIQEYYDRTEVCSVGTLTSAFAKDSWDTIVANINDTKYHVGDMKCVNLNGYTSDYDNGCDGGFLVRIANKSTPDECDDDDFSKTACGFVVEFVDIIENHVINTADTNSGSWSVSEMREYLNDTIFNALPVELQDEIIDTKVVTGYGYDDGYDDLNIATDKIYLLSPHEIYENTYGTTDIIEYDPKYENSRQLDYYNNNGVTKTEFNNTLKKYKGYFATWYLRTPYTGIGGAFAGVDGIIIPSNHLWFGANYKVGGLGIKSGNYGFGVVPAFRIG